MFSCLFPDSWKTPDSEVDNVVKAQKEKKINWSQRVREVVTLSGHFPVRLCDSWGKLAKISAFQRGIKRRKGGGGGQMPCRNLKEWQWLAQSGFLTKLYKNRRRFLKPLRVVRQPAPWKSAGHSLSFNRLAGWDLFSSAGTGTTQKFYSCLFITV